jgi:hypothetical protein
MDFSHSVNVNTPGMINVSIQVCNLENSILVASHFLYEVGEKSTKSNMSVLY